VKAVSHITGGGFFENIPRSLPQGCSAKIDKSLSEDPAGVRAHRPRAGGVPERDMFNTFNMGVGMVAAENPVDFAVVTPDDPLVLGAWTRWRKPACPASARRPGPPSSRAARSFPKTS
jgi:hypothetical protein